MKKFVSIALSVLLVFAMVACTAQTKPSQPSASDNTAAPDESSKPSSESNKPSGYPGTTISWIVPAAAGAQNDLITRSLSNFIDLGGNIVVENIPGATQTLGTAEAANRKADGCTLLTCANAGLLLASCTTEVTYSLDDFRHIAMIAPPLTMAICVSAKSDIKTPEDWINYITSGDTFYYSHAAGIGGLGYLASLYFLPQLNSTAGKFIAYNGSAEVMTALLNGEINWAILDPTDCVSHIEAGEMRAIYLVANEAPEGLAEALSDVPCISEASVDGMDSFVGLKWISIRKDTPDDVVEWIKQQLNDTIQSDEYKEWLNTSGYGEVRTYSEDEITGLLNNAHDLYYILFEQLGMAVSK